MLLIYVLTGIALLSPFGFHSESINEFCIVCGAQSHRKSVMGTPSVQTVIPTMLSRFVEKHGLASGHAHRWIFTSGLSSNGLLLSSHTRSCSPWGRLVMIVKNDQVVMFFEDLNRYAPEDVNACLAYALDYRNIQEFADSVFLNYPDSGFLDSDTFHAWWVKHKAQLNLPILPPAVVPETAHK